MKNVCLPSLPQCTGEEILIKEINHHNSLDFLLEQRHDIPCPWAAMHGEQLCRDRPAWQCGVKGRFTDFRSIFQHKLFYDSHQKFIFHLLSSISYNQSWSSLFSFKTLLVPALPHCPQGGFLYKQVSSQLVDPVL